MGIPTVNFVTEFFVSLAEATKKGAGLPDHRLVVIPRDVEKFSDEQINALAEEVFDKTVAAIATRELVHVPVSKKSGRNNSC